jgi:hydroxymethylglutaryl-CoA reductase
MRTHRARETPSGIDNTVANSGRAQSQVPATWSSAYRRCGARNRGLIISIPHPDPDRIGLLPAQLTSHTVGMVRRTEKNPARYEAIFPSIIMVLLYGALRHGDLAELGELMNINHGLLRVAGLGARCSRRWWYRQASGSARGKAHRERVVVAR